MKILSTPAFPVPGGYVYWGIDIRDYFAGQALVGIKANAFIAEALARTDMSEKEKARTFAVSAYTVADAMLAARVSDAPEAPA